MVMSTLFFLIAVLCVSLQFSCYKEDEGNGLHSIYQLDKYNPNKPLAELSSDWVKQTDLMEGFPSGIEFYKTNKSIGSKSSNLSLLIFRPSKGIDLKPIVLTSGKTPSAIYEGEAGEIYAVMNGGFFSGSTSLSLVMHDGVVGSVNVKSLTRPLDGVNKTYYPTRAALGITADFAPSVNWVYSVGSGTGTLYAYPVPSLNELGKAPLPVPTAYFPQGGNIWSVSTAIGGSPMLIKGGEINITDANELIAVDNTSSRARSAIGYLTNGNIVLLAAEGNNPDGAAGLTLQELAEIMLEIGCKGAINLDGGGSSSMVVNGEMTIKPSDVGGERKVISALIVKKK